MTRETRSAMIERSLTDPQIYFLGAELDGAIVGNIGLHLNLTKVRRRHVGAIGMSVRTQHHGQGIGSALMAAVIDLADNWLNLHRLELDVYTDNEPAIALYRKFGFEVEGTFRDYAYRNGTYVDSLSMARLPSARP
jgi:putative acetyltransferase